MISSLTARRIATDNGSVAIQLGGSGPPLLLLHGFPQTSLMWRSVAPLLLEDVTVIAADLPGYGASDCPPDEDHHGSMSKRSMAASLVRVMRELGHDRFAVVGHDRGGRVAYRMALDHPSVVSRVAVLDVVPIAEVWNRADDRLALSFWPFSLLAQPAPLPERLILGAADAVIDDALSQWGTPPEIFPAEVRRAYTAAISDPAHVHCICEDYRAAATIDREHDEADKASARRISCPLLVLWSAEGGLDEWYKSAGGPLGLWRKWTDDVHGRSVPGGHFFPEAYPELTANLLKDFLGLSRGPRQPAQ